MSQALAKKPANVMRTYTQQVRDHSSAMARLQDQYFAALKRAEAQYFEGVRKITDALTSQSAEIVPNGPTDTPHVDDPATPRMEPAPQAA